MLSPMSQPVLPNSATRNAGLGAIKNSNVALSQPENDNDGLDTLDDLEKSLEETET